MEKDIFPTFLLYSSYSLLFPGETAPRLFPVHRRYWLSAKEDLILSYIRPVNLLVAVNTAFIAKLRMIVLCPAHFSICARKFLRLRDLVPDLVVFADDNPYFQLLSDMVNSFE